MSRSITDTLERIRARYNELGELLSSPAVISHPSEIMKLGKERSDLEPKVQAFDRYLDLLEQRDGARTIINGESDPDLCELAENELVSLDEGIAELEEQLKFMLLPTDPLDGKDIVMEIRAGTGGEEAALFAGDLYRMYTHFADMKGWRTEMLSSMPSEKGGAKEIIFSIVGSEVYSHLKYESGVHRVQRVPETEASGRIHTSAASVVVMPEAEDVIVDIEPANLKIDVYRSSGPGGQSVNTTDSAVRITHLPTGMVVTCQDEKSQHKNKAKALKVLKARLTNMELEKQQNERSLTRKSMISTGDRSAKIRTYNYPQNRVTDHRINLTLYRLEEILAGDMHDLIESLRIEDRAKVLEAQAKEAV